MNPGVTIVDNQSGIACDSENPVAYTLTFTEGVQAIGTDDLTVTGATIDSVVHKAGENTATVNVTVNDGSTANVSITAKPSIVDIAGNPLVQAADNNQTVDTKNPTASYASEVKNQNTNGAADVASDADPVVAYTVTFSEPIAGIQASDIDVAGGTLKSTTLALSADKTKATFDVEASDNSVADLVVKV